MFNRDRRGLLSMKEGSLYCLHLYTMYWVNQYTRLHLRNSARLQGRRERESIPVRNSLSAWWPINDLCLLGSRVKTRSYLVAWVRVEDFLGSLSSSERERGSTLNELDSVSPKFSSSEQCSGGTASGGLGLLSFRLRVRLFRVVQRALWTLITFVVPLRITPRIFIAKLLE